MPGSSIKPGEVSVQELSKIYSLNDFDCEDNDLNEFLKFDSFSYKEQFIAKTFIVIFEEKVVGFFSVMNDAIKLKLTETEETIMLKRLHEYPSLKIGRLGVDKNYRGRGIGKLIIDFIVGLTKHLNKLSACRFISVDSYPNAVAFYEKHGFIKNLTYEKKKDFISMRLDIIDLISLN